MSVLYRAVWTSGAAATPEETVDAARLAVSRWMLSEEDAGSLPDGETVVGRRTAQLRCLAGPKSSLGFEARVRDEGAAVWTTVVWCVATSTTLHVAVDTSMQTDDVTMQVTVGRPRVVTDLLGLGTEPRLEGSKVLAGCLPIAAAEVPVLVEVLRSPTRSLPFVVFTETGSGDWQRWAEQVAVRAEGIANVVTLDRSAAAALRSAVGELGVWGGAVRTYMPAPLDVPQDGWRHRYVTVDRLRVHETATLNRVVFSVAQLSTRRRLPGEFQLFDPAPSPAAVPDREEELLFELELEREERAEVERELARAQGQLRRLETGLRKAGAGAAIWEAADPAADEASDDVQTVSDAVLAAQVYLAGQIVVPDGAAQQLEGIDTAPNAYAWANTTWRGLQALADYVDAKRSDFEGTFYTFCQAGHGGWPATKKKLTMVESETVRNNAKMHAARLFPVDERVTAEGRVYMESHLKISEGGGNLAPRVYFYDDTRGATGLVHVGFIGPHHLVPNTKA